MGRRAGGPLRWSVQQAPTHGGAGTCPPLAKAGGLTGASSRAGSCLPPPGPPAPPCPFSPWGGAGKRKSQGHLGQVAHQAQGSTCTGGGRAGEAALQRTGSRAASRSQVEGDGLFSGNGHRSGALDARPLCKWLHGAAVAGGRQAAEGGGRAGCDSRSQVTSTAQLQAGAGALERSGGSCRRGGLSLQACQARVSIPSYLEATAGEV